MGAKRNIEVRAYDRRLYKGEGEFEALEDDYFGWRVVYDVPNHVAAQYLMRRDDQVIVDIFGGRAVPAYIGMFELLDDAETSGFGGSARIQLRGKGVLPVVGL